MHILCSFTLGYFLFYDDEYGCVHYDDDDHHHALHDIRGFVVPSDVRLQPASLIMMSPGGVRTAW